MKNPNPILTIDICAFAIGEGGLEVLLIERADEPFAGRWALPGGFVHPQADRDVDAAAARILSAKAGLSPRYLEQVESIGNASRDPRGWSLTVLMGALYAQPVAGDGQWLSVEDAQVRCSDVFDHSTLIEKAWCRLRAKAGYTAHPLFLLPREFTLVDAQKSFEMCLGRPVEKKAFRRRLLDADILSEHGICEHWQGRGPKPMAYTLDVEKASRYIFPRALT